MVYLPLQKGDGMIEFKGSINFADAAALFIICRAVAIVLLASVKTARK